MIPLPSFTKLGCVLLVGSLAASGCLGSREWTYPPPPDKTYLGIREENPLPAKLVVLPLEDLRGDEIKKNYGKVAMPLVSFGVSTFDRPETIVDSEEIDELFFDPPKDFARALANEIQEANIFSTVAFSDGKTSLPSDYVLHGRLYSTQWKRQLTTYGLGPLGVVLWIAGLPMGEITTEVEMDLRLTSAGNPSQVLWSFAMDFQGTGTDGMYYGLKDSVQSYPVALQDALRSAIKDLAAKSKILIPLQ